ncbi:hypothetical protein A1O3_05545 [Capronia epimyces CBS 606.96]|uniref:NACHT domain-containing protein n=1 Tax=Capronia epimyces CBS 606.96 TaxID=1182542 RepID=W9Y5I4_9EURO|nr:uncharacterized protein A1O3_05545 [Capronia epimyces CBS 606.96]EXJ84870.1 hypothetical protein A1O3_05545 [Capronia epimyces CBS 606.96]
MATKVSSYLANGNGTQTSRHASYRLSTSRTKTTASGATGSAKMAEIVHILKRRCAEELGSAISNNIISSYQTLIEKISNERLRRLPTEGSAWDKVLAWAQSFAEKFNEFDLAIEQFTGGNYDGAEIAFGYCILLLELGDDNAAALQTSFGFFFKCSRDLIALLDRVELFNASFDINEQLVLAYADLVTLVSDVALRFYQAIRHSSDSGVSIDIYTAFAGTIESFQTRRDKIVESMWKYQLAEENVDVDSLVDIKTLRAWLAIQDNILKYKSGDHTALVNDRQQLTCLWVQPYLTRFLNGGQNSLAIVGPPGSGKTVLAGTIVDAVQRSSSRKSYTVLFVPINARAKSQAASLHVIRNLLAQLLESRVGNVEIYKVLSETYEASQKSIDVAAYESLLWNAFERLIALTHSQAKDTLIIVDGLDEVAQTPKEAQKLHQHLANASSKHEKVKLITLSQPSSLVSKTGTVVEITEDLIYDDVFAVVSNLLRNHPYLRQLSSIEQDVVVHQIVDASKSNFLWAKLAAKGLLGETSQEKFTKATAAIKKSPKPLEEIIRDHLVAANLSDVGRQLLTWLSISERPLTVEELSLLYAIDPKTGTISDKYIEPLHALKPVASLVFLQDGLVYLRHATIRQVLASHLTQHKPNLPVKEPSLDLVQRLWTYLRVSVKDHKEPSFSALTPAQVDHILTQYPLAEYAIRYWPSHYLEVESSSREISVELKKAFIANLPTSSTVPLLERSAWTWLPASIQVLWHSTALDVRQKVTEGNHAVVLQSVIILGSILHKQGDLQSAADLFYSASQLSASLFSTTHPLASQCATYFLNVTSTLTTTTRTDIMTRREEILTLLIKSSTTQYGATSEVVLTYKSQLIELYRTLKEESKAVEVETSIHGRDTQTSKDQPSIKRTGSLGVRVVSRRDRDFGYETWDWSEEHDHDIIIRTENSKHIDELLELAKSYTAKGLTAEAEQAYVEAWHLISLQSQTSHSLEVDRRKIELATTYAQFLQSTKRESEASALLTGVWEEYRSLSIAQSEEISSRLFQAGKVLKTLGIVTVALDIFRQYSSVTKSVSKIESSSYKEVEEQIQSTQKEILKQTASSSSSVTHVSQSAMTEIITSIESSKSTQIDITSTSAAKQVVVAYIAQKRWKEATVTIKRLLHIVWAGFFSSSIEDVGQPVRSPDFALELADQLIVCYESRLRTLKAQDLRERLFRAVKATRKIDDGVVQHNLTQLLRLFEQNRAREKIIQLHRELLEDYRKAYGPTHRQTIQTLWTLARLTSPEPISIEYYRQIVDLLSQGSDVCHPDAIDALSTVADHYWIERRYSDATWAYALLFRTFVKKGKESKQFQVTSFVSTVYSRYVDSLKVSSSDTAVTYEITKTYRQTCLTVFGADHKFTQEATLTLARLCRLSKRHEVEAVALYEQILKDVKAVEYHSESRATLDAIYEEQALEAVRSSTISASSEQVERAVTVVRKRLTESRSQYGWTHDESLEQLKEMTYLYAKRSKKEEAVQELITVTSHIVSSEQRSDQLIRGAIAVASSFVAVNETHRGLEVAEELRWQLVTKDASNSKKYNLDFTSTSRSAAIYIAQLEYSLRQDSSASFSSIYVSILTEIVYYEEFQRSIRSNLTVEEVFAVAARLHAFLSLQKRSVLLVHVEDQLVSFFLRTSGDKAKVGDVAQVKVLVTTMLAYLRTHQVKNFLHSINLASIEHVKHLLRHGQHKQACDLAQTAFRYSHASGWYDTPAAIKDGLVLAIAIADISHRGTTRRAQIQIASSIVRQMLDSAKQLKLNLAAVPLKQTNIIVSILGEEKDYITLEALLTTLWETRETHAAWGPSLVLALGRRLVLARFLLKKYDLALHLAADIAYNLRRVYGSSHVVTLEMNILLGQLNVSTGLALQSTKGAEEIARRYYKRAIGVHENVLRSLTLDPLGLNEDDDVTVLSADPEPVDLSALGLNVDGHAGAVSPGVYARRHLILLKLALERFGVYPKGYAEYEQLNADLFHTFPEELRGIEGVEKWDLKKFGNGRAASDEGVLDTQLKTWALTEQKVEVNGNGAHAY